MDQRLRLSIVTCCALAAFVAFPAGSMVRAQIDADPSEGASDESVQPTKNQPASGTRPERPRWQPIGRLDPNRVREASGIVKSRQYPDIFWTHGDSLNPAVLFAFRLDGELVAEVPVPEAPNTDWEDIAIDDDGHLYIGDLGNNFGLFAWRFVYVIDEPDPFADPPTHAKLITRYRYGFDDDRFDAESLYVIGEQMFIIDKPRSGKATLFELMAESPGTLKPTARGKLPLVMVTGADVSRDQKWLVVSAVRQALVFSMDDQLRPVLNRPLGSVVYPRGQIEACCFDGNDLVFLDESGHIYKVTQRQWEANTAFVSP